MVLVYSLTKRLILPLAQAAVPATVPVGATNSALRYFWATAGVTVNLVVPQVINPLLVPKVAPTAAGVSCTPIHMRSVAQATAFAVVMEKVAV